LVGKVDIGFEPRVWAAIAAAAKAAYNKEDLYRSAEALRHPKSLKTVLLKICENCVG
jgi:hypothetical protein